MSMTAITPILIFGENRNGTTWLGNTLIKEFDVFMPHHKLHFGMLETSLFSINQKWKDFHSKADYQSFLNEFSTSDLFITTHGRIENYQNKAYDNYYQFFIALMHSATIEQNKKTWAIKIEPRHLYHTKEWNKFIDILIDKYGSIKYIVIQRDFEDYFKSAKNLYTISKTKNALHKSSWLNSAIIAARYKKFYSKTTQLRKHWDHIKIQYDSLKNQHEQTLGKISNYIKIPQSTIECDFIKNSSSNASKYSKSIVDNVICVIVNKSILADKIIIGIQELLYKIIKPNTDYIKYRIIKFKEDPDQLNKEIPDSFEKDFNQFKPNI